MTEYVRLPDGKLFPAKEGETPLEAMEAAYKMYPQSFGIMPEEKPKGKGSKLKDLATEFGQSALGSTKALTDVFGAENVASQFLEKKAKAMGEGLSPERQAEIAAQQERMRQAEATGSMLEELKAGAQNVAEAPAAALAQATGSLVPYVLTNVVGTAARFLKLAPATVQALEGLMSVKNVATVQGVGAVKGSIYDAVYQRELEASQNPELAARKAELAQNYLGKNLDQIALGGALGRVAGSTGAERLLTKAGMAEAPQAFIPRMVRAAGEEFLTEAPQGAQERLAANLASQRTGFDVPTMQGVVGQGVQEGLMGVLGAAPIAALRGPGRGTPTAAPGAVEEPVDLTEEQAKQEELLRLGYTPPAEPTVAKAKQEKPLDWTKAKQAEMEGFGKPGKVEEPKAEMTYEEYVDYKNKLRLVQQQRQDLSAAAQGTTDLARLEQLANQDAQLEKAQKELERLTAKRPRTEDEVYKSLTDQLAKAKELGDTQAAGRIAAKLRAMGERAEPTTKAPEQLSFDLEPFKGKSEGKAEFGARVYKPGAPEAEAEEAALREGQYTTWDDYRAELRRRQEEAADKEIAALEAKRLRTEATVQGDLFGEAGTTAVTGGRKEERPSEGQVVAALRIARLTGNREKASELVETLRDLREEQKKPARGISAETAEQLGGGRLPIRPAMQAQAADNRAAAFADIVNLISKYNRGLAKPDELQAARNKLLENLVNDVEATNGKPMEDSARAQMERDANRLLNELVNRFGDTRNMTMKPGAKRPMFVFQQTSTGEFTKGEAPGTGFPTVESAIPGQRTFGDPFAASMSIKEGIDELRNKAVGAAPTTTFTRTLTPTKVTPEMLVGELDRAFAKGVEGYTPEQRQLLMQIADNLDAISANEDNRSTVAEWAYRAGIGQATPELTQEVRDILAAGERAKISETETTPTGEVRRAVQKEIPTGEERGRLFESPEEFQKYLASDALQQLRSDMGLIGPTLARLTARLKPFQERAAKLREEGELYAAEYDRLQGLRRAQLTELENLSQTELAAQTREIKAAEEIVAEARARILDMQRRLDEEVRELDIAYQEAARAFELSAKTSEDITKAIQENTDQFNADVAKATQELADAKADLTRYLESQHPAERKIFGGMTKRQQDIARGVEQKLPTDVGVMFLQTRVVDATRNLARVMRKADGDEQVIEYLQKDLDLQIQLADEARIMDTAAKNLVNAQMALYEAKEAQERDPDNQKELKEIQGEIAEANQMLAQERAKAQEIKDTIAKIESDLGFDTQTISHRISETESRIAVSRRRATTAEAEMAELADPLLTQAQRIENTATKALDNFIARREAALKVREETLKEKTARDNKQRRLENDTLERLAAMPGEEISFEQRRRLIETSGTSEEAIGELKDAADEAETTLDRMKEADIKLAVKIDALNAEIAKLEKLTKAEPRTFQNKLLKKSRLIELDGLRQQRDAMLKTREQLAAGTASIEKAIAEANEQIPKLLVKKDFIDNVVLSNEPEHRAALIAELEKEISRTAEGMKRVKGRINEMKPPKEGSSNEVKEKYTKLRKSRQNDLSRYKREYDEAVAKRDALRGVERKTLPAEPLATEPFVPGRRLKERKRGPVVRSAVQAGNVRTGTLETAGERKLSTRNKPVEAGQVKRPTPAQIMEAVNKDVSFEQAMLASDELDRLMVSVSNALKKAQADKNESEIARLEKKLEGMEKLSAKLEVKAAKGIRQPAQSFEPDKYEFSRGVPVQGQTVASLQKELDKALGGAGLTSRKVKLFDTVNDLFADREYGSNYTPKEIPSDAKAFVDPKTGMAFMFAKNIGKNEGLGVLLHEVGVHLGFRNLFNTSQYNALVKTVQNWANKTDNSLEARIAKRAKERVEAAETSKEQYNDELLAYTVEEAIQAGVKPSALRNGSPIQNWLSIVLDTLKRALAAFGINPKTMTAGDLVNMAYGAAQLEIRGTWHGSDAKFTAFDTKYAGTGEGAFDLRFVDENSLGAGPYTTPDKAYAEYYQHAVPFGKAANETGYGFRSYQDYRANDGKYMVKSQYEPMAVADYQNIYESNLLTRYLTSVSAGGELDPSKNREAQLYVGNLLDSFTTSVEQAQKVLASREKRKAKPESIENAKAELAIAEKQLKAAKTLDVNKIKGLTERPQKGYLYRSLDAIPREKVFSINSALKFGDRPKIDALYEKYGQTLITTKEGDKVDTNADGDKYYANRMFYKMRSDLGIEKTIKLLKDAGIEAIEQLNDRTYIERAYIDQAPEILAVDLKPVGPAKGLLFSKPATKLEQFAADIIAQPLTLKQRVGTNPALEFEMQGVDMRAGLREVLKHGDDKLFKQAMYSVLKADQKMPQVYTVLNNGPLELYKDDKGFMGVRSTNKNAAKEVFEAIANIPLESGKARVDVATAYMIAQRAVGKSGQIDTKRLLGMDESKVRAVLAEVDRNPALKSALEKVRNKYNAYNKGMIDFAAATGAITKAQAEDLNKSGDYVPFYRVTENGMAELVYGDDTIISIGDIRQQPYLEQLKGGEQKILPLNESLYRNTLLLTDKALTNMATRNVAYGLQALGEGKGAVNKDTGKPTNLMPIHKGSGPADASIIRFSQEPDPADPDDNGKRWLKVVTKGTAAEGVPAELVVKSLEGSHLPLPQFLKTAGMFSDLLRSGVTRMPPYILRQLIRDPMAATFTGGLNYGPLTAVLKAGKEFIAQTRGDSQTAAKLLEKGLIQSNIFAGDADDMSKIALQIASGKDQNAMEKLFAALDRAALRADAATRALVYENAVKNGLSEVEADMMTMESMNFYKRGLNPLVQYGNRLIPFLNAQIQGLNVLAKAFRGNMPFEQQLEIRQKFFNNAMFLFATGLVYALAMDDDDTFRNARPRDKYANFFLNLPGVDEAVKIPIPYEAGYFFSAAVAMADAMKKETNTREQFAALRDMFLNSIPGYSSAGLPQIVKPVYEVWTNKNFMTGTPIETARMEGKDITERFNANTTEFAKGLSKALPLLSPVQIEHIARAYLGVAPIAAMGVMDSMLRSEKAGEAPERRLSETPVVGGLFQKRYGGADADVMYRYSKEAIEARDTFNAMRKAGRIDDAREFMEENRDKITAAPMAGVYRQLVGRLNTDMDRVRTRPDLSAAEKRQRLDELEARKQEVANRFMERFNARTTLQ